MDLHIHSTYSDGTYTPEEIIKKAKQNNVDVIALTDHNTLQGLSDFAYFAHKYNQKAFSGIEITTVYNNTEIHLLAYYPLDTDFSLPKYEPLIIINNKYKYGKKYQLEKIIRNISKDYDVSINDFYKYIKTTKDDDNFNRVHVANYLRYKGMIDTINEGFDTFLNEKSEYYFMTERTKLLDAIEQKEIVQVR